MTRWLGGLLALALLAGCGAPPTPPAPSWHVSDGWGKGGKDAENLSLVAAGDEALLAWLGVSPGSTGLWVLVRTKGGWQGPTRFGGDKVRTYALAANAAGQAVLAWSENGELRVVRRDRGGWHGAETLAGVEPSEVAAGVDGAGRAFVAWPEKVGSHWVIRVARGEGGRWQTATVSPVNTDASEPAVAVDEDGRALLVWAQDTGTGVQIGRAEYDGGWGTPEIFAQVGFSDDRPTAARDGDRALVVWNVDEMMEPGPLAVAERMAGTWMAPRELGSAGAEDPALALTGDRALVAWTQPFGGKDQVFAWEKAGVWGRPLVLSLPGTDAAQPRVALGSAGGAVVWHQADDRGRERLYAAILGENDFWLPANPADAISPEDRAVADLAPAVAVDGQGAILVAWLEAGLDGRVRFAEFR